MSATIIGGFVYNISTLPLTTKIAYKTIKFGILGFAFGYINFRYYRHLWLQ